MDIHRNAAPVVADQHGIVDINLHMDHLAVTRQMLIDRIVDQFVHQVVQTSGGYVTNVHSGTATDMVGVAQHLHRGAIVITRHVVGIVQRGGAFVGEFGFGLVGLGLAGHGFFPSLVWLTPRCLNQAVFGLSSEVAFLPVFGLPSATGPDF